MMIMIMYIIHDDNANVYYMYISNIHKCHAVAWQVWQARVCRPPPSRQYIYIYICIYIHILISIYLSL